MWLDSESGSKAAPTQPAAAMRALAWR